MAESDWTLLTDSIDNSVVRRGVSALGPTPPGGGTFMMGMNSRTTTTGAVGMFTNQLNFAPMAKGGRVQGAVKRGTSGGPEGFAPFLFIGLQGNTVNDAGYLLGLSNSDPHRIVLRKGTVVSGLPDDAPGTNGVLARGTTTYENNTWLHLRLDMRVNSNGDVVLNCYQSDLSLHSLGSPVWQAIPGISQVIDDVLGVTTGSDPFLSGYAGFACQFLNVNRRAYFDHLQIRREL